MINDGPEQNIFFKTPAYESKTMQHNIYYKLRHTKEMCNEDKQIRHTNKTHINRSNKQTENCEDNSSFIKQIPKSQCTT